MARDGSGTYTLPLAAVVTGTAISATWANTTLDDIAAELTDSLDRYGRGGMTVAYENSSGTTNAPGITFSADTSIGIRRAGVNVMSVVVNATNVARWRDDTATAAGSQRPFEIFDGASPFDPLNEAQLDDLVTFGKVTSRGAVTLFDSLTVTAGGLNTDADGVTVAGDLDITGALTVVGSVTTPIPAYVSAYVTSTGTLSQNIGVASASRVSLGKYLLTLDTNWTDTSNPVAVASPKGDTSGLVAAGVYRAGANTITVYVYNPTTGGGVDADFSFFGVN